MNYISIPHNEKSKHEWDIEEDDGFSVINGYKMNHGFSRTNIDKAVHLLYLIDLYIHELKQCMINNPNPHCVLFVETPHILQEISYSNQLTKFNGKKTQKFEGINKPKGIMVDNTTQFRDKYKCRWRLVMLALRRKDFKLRSWKKIKKLLLHELAHTMCNHILYYSDENHESDFDEAEAFLHKCSTMPNVTEIEKSITSLY